MAVDGYLNFNTKINTKGFNAGTKQITSSLTGMKSMLGKIGLAMGTAFSVRAVVNFGKEAINTASDIQEVQNVVDVSFGKLKGKMEEFADTAIETYGISKLTAKQTGSTYMAMAKGMQIADEKAADMALTLTGLSADMASFYNKEQSVTSTALSSIFTGETETLKQFGIVMTEANLQQFAYTQGINKKISAMSQAEKVMLRYNYVMSQTALAQGDFVRTQDGWANQTRILTEQWREFSGAVGTIFMNTLLPAVQNLNKAMLWLNSIASSVLENLAAIFDWDISSSGGGIETYEGISDAIGTSVENQNALTDAVKETAEAQKRELMGFDKINKLSDDSSSSGGSSGGVSAAGGGMSATMKLDADTSEAERKLTGFAANVKTAWESGDYEGLGSLFASKVNSALDKFANEIDYEGIKERIRPKIQNIATVFNSFVDGVDWSLLAEGISRGLALALGMVDITLDALDFEAIGGTVSEFLSGIDVPALGAELGSLLSTVFSGGIDLLSGFIQEIDWEKILFGVYDGIKSFISNIDWGEIAGSVATHIGSMWGNLFELSFNAAALIGTIGEDISKAFKNIGDYFDESIEEAGGNIVLGIWNGITDALSNVGQWIKDNIFTPFINGFKKAFGINSPATTMKPMGGYIIDGLKEGIGDVWSKLQQKFTDMLTKAKNWFKEKKADFSSAWNDATAGIKDKTATVKLKWSQKKKDITEAAQTRYKAITSVFGKIPEWFRSKFADAWKKVKGVFSSGGETFKDIKDGILTSLKTIINKLIDGINAIIKKPFDGINTALKKLKEIKIGSAQPFKDKIQTITVPKIPKLATGTVVPANFGEFLAVLGDNKREPEIVSPESAIRKVVSEELKKNGGGAETINLVVNLDGEVLYRTVVKRNIQNKNMTGVNELASA